MFYKLHTYLSFVTGLNILKVNFLLAHIAVNP